MTLLTQVFPDRAHIIETVEFFARGLAHSSADRKRSERGCRLCKTYVRCKGDAGKTGSNVLDERGSMMNEGKTPKEGATRPGGGGEELASLP